MGGGEAHCTNSAWNSLLYIFINEGVSDFHEIRDGLVLYEYDMQLIWNSEIPRVLNMTPHPHPHPFYSRLFSLTGIRCQHGDQSCRLYTLYIMHYQCNSNCIPNYPTCVYLSRFLSVTL